MERATLQTDMGAVQEEVPKLLEEGQGLSAEMKYISGLLDGIA
jgi:hypothetical protein